MGQTCSKCSRVNPAEAAYCYFDGALLDGHGARNAPINTGSAPFNNPFVFPSGQTCRNFDQLALTCQQNWKAALDLLKQGFLEGFLGNLGRVDLARAAREAANFPDKDRGLDQFLSALPSEVLTPPKLLVEPRDVSLGQLRYGEDRRLNLQLSNQGMRLLYGSVVCENGLWLSLGDGPGSQQKLFEFSGEMTIPLNVRGKALRAGNKPLEGRLVFDSNGGQVVVVVRAEVPVTPFKEGVLAGARSPRQIAEKAKANPKDAAVLFERGTVAQWYKDNGWVYPVQGPSASGLGAVQQFFEALGLTKPPKLEIPERTINFVGPPGGRLEHTLTVRSPEKRPVYAYAKSNQDWLKIGRPQLNGNVVTLPVYVPAIPMRSGETLLAKIKVTANGNQRFVVPVALAVTGTAPARLPEAILVSSEQEEPALLAPVGQPAIVATLVEEAPVRLMPVAAAQPALAAAGAEPPVRLTPVASAVPLPSSPVQLMEAASPAAVKGIQEPILMPPTSPRPRTTPSNYQPPAPPVPNIRQAPTPPWVHGLPIAFLAFFLLLIVIHDFFVKGGGGTSEDEGLRSTTPQIDIRFHDTAGFGINYPTMRFGLVTQDGKNLTYAAPGTERGVTNNTCLRIDGNEQLFGDGGTWHSMKVGLGKDPTGRERIGARSVWEAGDRLVRVPKIIVTQTVELIPGDQTRMLDTCLVRYTIENGDTQPHNVGIRFMLDTYIGANDGVPFTIPGERDLCVTFMDMRERIPDYVEALEKNDLRNPGTIAHLKLKLGGNVEAPERVTIGAWPHKNLQGSPQIPAGAAIPNQHMTGWEVPVLPIDSITRLQGNKRGDADSCVVMYWMDRELRPTQKREVGFAYGLGELSSDSGKLGLTVDGSFAPGGTFTLTAYVSNPDPNESLTLSLPEGFTLVGGSPTERVPAATVGGRSQVSWKIKSPDRKGWSQPLQVRSSTGASQSKRLLIKGSGIFD